MLGRALCAALVAVAAIAVPASAASKDPAARGMDLFLHAPKSVPSGGTWPVQIRVFGFPTVSTLASLAGATVEAVWDPESLGDKAAVVPKPIAITCDEAGRGHLDMAVPLGRGKLNLLVCRSRNWNCCPSLECCCLDRRSACFCTPPSTTNPSPLSSR